MKQFGLQKILVNNITPLKPFIQTKIKFQFKIVEETFKRDNDQNESKIGKLLFLTEKCFDLTKLTSF